MVYFLRHTEENVKNVKLISESDLPYTSDREIGKTISLLKEKVNSINPEWRLSRNRRIQEQCLSIETEICYLQREIMWRKRREASHKEYMRTRRRRSL